VSGELQRWLVCGRCAACLYFVSGAPCSVSKMGAIARAQMRYGSVHVPSHRAFVRRSERTGYVKGTVADVVVRHC
jgi:hypothetical protein